MTREEAKKFVSNLRLYASTRSFTPEDHVKDADALLALIDREVAAAIQEDREMSYHRRFDYGDF